MFEIVVRRLEAVAVAGHCLNAFVCRAVAAWTMTFGGVVVAVDAVVAVAVDAVVVVAVVVDVAVADYLC